MSNHATDMSHAFSLHQSGRLGEARSAYEHILESGDNAEALHLLGVLELQAGNAPRAATLLKQASELDPTDPRVFANLGNACMALSRFSEALAAFESSLQLNAASPETLASLGNVYLALQCHKEAVRYYKEALKLNSSLAEAWRCLATALSATGDNRNALEAVQNAEREFERRGHSAPLPLILTRGNVLMAMGHPDQALMSFKTIVDTDPGFAQGHISLGNAYQALGNFRSAADHFDRAVALEPDNAEAYFALGVLRQDEGNLELSRALLTKTLELNSLHGRAHRLLASLTRFEPGHPGIERMQAVLASDVTNEQRKHVSFALGKAFEDCAEYELAFDSIQMANSLHRSSIDYSVERDVEEMSQIAHAFNGDFVQKHCSSGALGADNPVPIFIVGMPRSGTSLIEQILASHPEVHGAGELDWFELGIDQVLATTIDSRKHPSSRISRLANFTTGQLRDMGERYRKRLATLSERRWIVDKMPANFRHVGLIRAALPDAVVVHAQRHPAATCWSIYKHFLGKTGHAYSFDLTELGQYYRAYSQLMQHWQGVFSGIQSVHYEALVSEPEVAIRKLLGLGGLEWHDACLEFHQTRRPVKTLSASQVRRPIYTDALAQWQHYSNQLEPLLQGLGEVPEQD